MEEADGQEVDLDRLMETDSGEDKIFAAMGVAKTITTVSKSEVFWRMNHLSNVSQVVTSVDAAPEILAQVQEIVIPIILLTLEGKLLGKLNIAGTTAQCKTHNSGRPLRQYVRTGRCSHFQDARYFAHYVACLRDDVQAIQVRRGRLP